ncbi:hypothetical protein GO986_12515 [Deinococcus sp. HMF7620]|uniref:Uncharacterized protein n=1 Tax=Deinococcus arboris TaxID=2682977 RepID=A0A7C9HS79_9DEIO|nr:hypothetical protein [Deinococcus arboris]MVN87589.1 hypothetical protein [Deinococcus arboris]
MLRHSAFLFLSLFSLTSAALAAAPAALTGEWLIGTAYPANIYDKDAEGAQSSSTRLLLRPDGTYALTDLQLSYIPGYFGSYLVTCETLNVFTESGKYQVTGNKLSFQPGAAQKRIGVSPGRLNAGCKRFEGTRETVKQAPYQGTFTLAGGTLTLNARSVRQAYSRRPAETAKPAAPVLPSPSISSVRPAAAPVSPAALITPAPWTATGTWAARFDTPNGPVEMRFSVYDDGEGGLSGSGTGDDDLRGWLLGSSAGQFKIGLSSGDDELNLELSGRFSGDRYEGTFQASAPDGEALLGGRLTMLRDTSTSPSSTSSGPVTPPRR